MTLQATQPDYQPDYQRYSMASLQQALSGQDGADPVRRQVLEAEIAKREHDDREAAQRQYAARPQDKPLDPATAALMQAARPSLNKAGYALLFCWAALQTIYLIQFFRAGPRGVFLVEFSLLILSILLLRGSLRAAIVVRWIAAFCLVPAILSFDYLILPPLDLALRQFALAPLSSTVQLLQFVLHLLLLIYVYRWLGAAPVMAACDASGRKRRDMRIPAILGLLLGIVTTVFLVKALHGEVAAQALALAKQHYGSGYQYYVNAVGEFSSPQGDFYTAQIIVWNEQGIMQVPARWPK